MFTGYLAQKGTADTAHSVSKNCEPPGGVGLRICEYTGQGSGPYFPLAYFYSAV